ncbi:hypothetical protein [Pseudonocardia sp. GCM10023141]|uniref:hypothetical protein n=1 Tax=Pseudonocardia sp. GCM10023141 TaxID=3252653 RepID=UPI0036150ACF
MGRLDDKIALVTGAARGHAVAGRCEPVNGTVADVATTRPSAHLQPASNGKAHTT